MERKDFMKSLQERGRITTFEKIYDKIIMLKNAKIDQYLAINNIYYSDIILKKDKNVELRLNCVIALKGFTYKNEQTKYNIINKIFRTTENKLKKVGYALGYLYFDKKDTNLLSWAKIERAIKEMEDLVIREEKETKEREEKKLYIPFDSILDVLMNNEIVKRNKPFKLILISYINPDIKKEVVIKSINHLTAWYNKVINTNSVNYNNQDVLQDENVFLYVKIEVEEIKGGCSRVRLCRLASNSKPYLNKKYKNSKYRFNLISQNSQRNDCGIETLRYILKFTESNLEIRKKFNLEVNTMIEATKILEIYNKLSQDNIPLEIISIDYNDSLELLKGKKLIFYYKNHYYNVENVTKIDKKNKRKARGELFWDIETRKTDEKIMIKTYDSEKDEIVPKESYVLKDAITCIYYKKAFARKYEQLYFKTDESMSSVRKFIEWIKNESTEGYIYNCYAHNSSRFDNYFLLANLTEEETRGIYMNTRGANSLICIDFMENKFKDTYCFLSFSLNNLCESFKIKNAKKKEIIFSNGNVLSNEQLCFYKPELNFDSFLDLENNDKEFWKLYVDYCMYDCISLKEIWGEFTTKTNEIIEKINPHLMKTCRINNSVTLGGLAMKMMEGLHRDHRTFKLYLNFLTDSNGEMNEDKYNFVKLFKRGGISHCNKPGLHKGGMVSYDICSQYPASMSEMIIPAGISRWTNEYDEKHHGLYYLKNLKFDGKYSLKPVCEIQESSVLKWDTNEYVKEAYVTSEMIKYLKSNYGLISFDVDKALVSNNFIKGSAIFGKYVDTLFNEKSRQDTLKKQNQHNPAYRETIKLFLNAITGKFVENTEEYVDTKLTLSSQLIDELKGDIKDETKLPEVDDEESFDYEDREFRLACNNFDQLNVQKKKMNNNYVIKYTKEGEKKKKLNKYVLCGVMIYCYSKRLLFEYIKLLPNNSDDVVHIETDSIYFPKVLKNKFVENINNYNRDEGYPVIIGDCLGNVKQEKNVDEECYFLGKKFYKIGDIMKIKGIPLNTIDNAGNKINIVNEELYKKVYNGQIVKCEYKSLVKSLYGKTRISEVINHRTVKLNNKVFEWMNGNKINC